MDSQSLCSSSSNIDGSLKASQALRDKSHRAAFALDSLTHSLTRSWVGTLGFAVAIGITYFMVAWLSLTLRAKPEGVAFFWPAAGIAVGALVVLGPSAWLPGAIAVASASVATNLLIGRNIWLVVVFALVNVAQALLTAWLIERWFGRTIKLEDVRQVLGFLVASAVGAAIVAVGAAGAVALVDATASPLPVLRLLFVGCLLGVVTVAPVLIGLGEAVRELPPRRELIEGAVGLATLAVLSVIAISLPEGPGAASLPEILVFCPLLWVAVRCRPVFSAAATFLVALAVVWSKTLNLGYFGDASIPLMDRLFAAQSFVLAAALVAFVLAGLFAERRRSEAALELSNELLGDTNERLELALGSAELGAFSLDLDTGLLECDARTAHIHGHVSRPNNIKIGRRFVHVDDRVRIDTLFAEAQSSDGIWSAEYRVVHPPGHPYAGEVRWVAFEGSTVRGAQGKPVRLLGISRDITYRKQAEQALAERDAQLAIAGKFALVGSFTFDVRSGKMQISPGYAAIHGLPEEAIETNRSDWRARVHPDDLPRLEADLQRDIDDRRNEHHCDYRIIRSGGEVRWIEARSFISYDRDGAAQRIDGANIDVTERKKAERALAERTLQLALAGKAGLVGSYSYDTNTELMQISEGYAAIHGVPETTTEIARSRWQANVHPEDRVRLEALRSQAFREQKTEQSMEYRIVRDGDVRWIESRSFIIYNSDGVPQRVIGVNIDITERKRVGQTLAERKAQLELANNIAQVGSYTYNYATRTLWLGPGSASIYGLRDNSVEMTAEEWRQSVHPDDVAQLVAESCRALANRQREIVCVFRILRQGEVRWIETRNRYFYDKAGRATQAIGVSIDVTERRRAEDHKGLLVAELDHRVKNALACVAAIAQHAREGSNTMNEFLDGFKGRIQCLANAHVLLSRTCWQGVSLAALVHGELSACMKDDNTDIHGPDIDLVAEATQPIAMVLHELATNAGKYGALSNSHGRVSVCWEWQLNGGSSSGLVLEWRETGGPPVVTPRTYGYGSTVIRDLIPYELGGTVDFVLAPDGVSCKLELPAKWLSHRTQSSIAPPIGPVAIA